MPKIESLKASSITKEESNAGKEKSATSSRKVDEIDNIFASRKRKKQEQEKAERTSDKNENPKKAKKKKKKSIPKEVEALNPDSKPRRRTNDGLAVFTEEELGINSQDAGSTALCPFDCSCCF